jgi:hypothetical protein
MKTDADVALENLQAESSRRLRELARWMIESAEVFTKTYGGELLEMRTIDEFSETLMEIAEQAGNTPQVLELLAEKIAMSHSG